MTDPVAGYLKRIPPGRQQKLKQVIDSDNEVERDLIAIAKPLTDWELNLSEPLGLKPYQVADLGQIRVPELRRREVLRVWRNRLGLGATYLELLSICAKAGCHDVCMEICRVVAGSEQLLQVEELPSTAAPTTTPTTTPAATPTAMPHGGQQQASHAPQAHGDNAPPGHDAQSGGWPLTGTPPLPSGQHQVGHGEYFNSSGQSISHSSPVVSYSANNGHPPGPNYMYPPQAQIRYPPNIQHGVQQQWAYGGGYNMVPYAPVQWPAPAPGGYGQPPFPPGAFQQNSGFHATHMSSGQAQVPVSGPSAQQSATAAQVPPADSEVHTGGASASAVPKPESLLDEEFDLAYLKLINYVDPKTGNRKKIEIFKRLAPDWRDVAMRIGLEEADISTIVNAGSGTTPEMCLMQVLKRWGNDAVNLSNYSRYPETWRGVCNLLDDSHQGILARNLRIALDAETNTLRKNYPEDRSEDRPSKQVFPVKAHMCPEGAAVPKPGATKTLLESYHYGILCEQLHPCAHKWKEIAKGLRFQPYEIENIQADPLKLSGAPGSYLGAVLSSWMLWAPGDARGSKDFATLEYLKWVVSQVGFPKVAASLKLEEDQTRE